VKKRAARFYHPKFETNPPWLMCHLESFLAQWYSSFFLSCVSACVPRNLTSDMASLSQLQGFAHVCSTYMSVCNETTLHKYMCVRMLGCMSTPLYVHVTHTQHTHTHTHNTQTHTIIEFSTRLLIHQISLSVGPKHPNYSDESAPRS